MTTDRDCRRRTRACGCSPPRPTIWAAHFLLCYVTAAIWCAKVAGPDGSLGGVRVAIAVYTVLALDRHRDHRLARLSPAQLRHAPPCRTTSTRRRIGTASWASPRCCCRA